MILEEIQVVACLLEKYADIINTPNIDNKIEIVDKTVRIIKDGKVLAEKPITTDAMQLSDVEYVRNVFNSNDIAYSPLEADREENHKYWKKKYGKINVPMFIPIPLVSWLALGKIPDIVDFCKIYLLAYTEPVTKSTYIQPDVVYATDVNIYSNVGKTLTYTDGQILKNRVLRYKRRYLKYVSGLPINQFTTEQICCRIYKLYGSCIRDPYNMIRMSELGAKTVYDTYLDFVQGVDGIINNVPYYGYSKTQASYDFRDIKVNERHKDLNPDKGIVIIKKGENKNGVYLTNDFVFVKILSEIQKKKIEGINVFEG